ncbi:hypothetical protein [Cohnella cholangitidis]|uniref:DUF4399 domain-containing protein n=1 Tax=Cohnella cholangitidis TaxID=2598458 RepID=A0A7G5BW77_9BACL|nr:hypothetical protein [Cohnella cholangitidis]QMV41211.1 hypothetical protein FPL14_08400 [Cohnella cholangitidis]
MRNLALLLFCCLLLTACGTGTKSNSGSHDAHAAHKPTLDVALDVQGNQVTVTVNTDMAISPEHYGMARKAGEGHIHMYLDDQNKISVKENQHIFTDLAAGKHSLKVSLHNNDHTPYDVTNTYEFEVQT